MSKGWLLGFLLGVPLIGFAVAEGMEARVTSQVRAIVRHQVRDRAPERVVRLSGAALCQEDRRDTAALCVEYRRLALMSQASLWTGVVGVALVLLITAAGAVARGNRNALVWVFRPGLYFTAAVLTLLIAAHAAILMSAIVVAEMMLIKGAHFGIVVTIGVGALAGVMAVARGAFSVVKRAETSVFGTTIPRQSAPGLWAVIESAAARLGALTPDAIVAGLDPNFFVTEADVVTNDGRLSGRTLYCSLPLARILTVSEFTAIMAHELGHFRGEDTKFSERFYPIYRGAGAALDGLYEAAGNGAGIVALLPAMGVFSYFLSAFAVAESRLGRRRELVADQAAAAVTSQLIVAASLVKVHAYADVWGQVRRATLGGMKRGRIFANASAIFADTIAQGASRKALQNVSDVHLPHPTDSHPSLSERLESLHVSLDSVRDAAMQVSPADSAATLIADVEKVEEELTAAYQELWARRLWIDIRNAHIERRAPMAHCATCDCDVLSVPDEPCPQCGQPMKTGGPEAAAAAG
jgi:Zn-dependent protease with chaperone function